MIKKHLLFTIVFLAISTFYWGKAQEPSSLNQPQLQKHENIIYSNSFESPQDTVGMRGNGMIEFSSDVPPGSGIKSLYISGGCIWPHASIELGPFYKDGLFLLRCWGKDLEIGLLRLFSFPRYPKFHIL